MRRNATIAITLFVLLWTGVRFVFAQSNVIIPVPYVYRIDVKGCEFEPKNRRQTGFRVEGTTGIVTTLHGVADCMLIDATADGGQEQYTQLTIRQVDIAHDVVVLSSPTLDELPADGLAVSPLSTTEILTASLRIVGYPRGLEDQDVDVVESIRDVESLDAVIPDAEEPAAFIKRKSPDLNIQVLNVQAQLLPGHSGAPLIDSEDRVVAIGNGGLRAGSDGRSWAILWNADDLQSVELDGVQARLAELAEKDIAALSFSSTFPSQVDDAVGMKPYTVQVIDAGDSQPIANAEVLLTHSAGYEIGVTDSEGFYTFRLADDDGLDYAESQLQVEAVGYVSYSRSVPNVLARVGPEKVRLDVVEATTTVPPLEKTETSLCEFAFLILDKLNEQPIAKASLIITIGTAPKEGQTDSNGFYRSQLPCNEPSNASALVHVAAPGYQPHKETVVLVDETKEILLSPVTSESSASPAVELVVNVARCNVRRGPETNESIIGIVSAGEKLIAIGKNSAETWWQIEHEGQVGWVAAQCVDSIDQAPPSSTNSSTSTPAPVATRAQISSTAATVDLRVFDKLEPNSYLLRGSDVDLFNVEDNLVVYGEPNPGIEVAIALLTVIGKSPNSLTAQVILSDPETEIRTNMRVDDKLGYLSESQLIPVFEYVDGYLLRPTRIRLRPDHELMVGAQLQALAYEYIGEAIVDAFPMDPPVQMRVTSLGLDGQIAGVELIAGEWPVTGTAVSLVELQTVAPSPSAAFTPTPTATLPPTWTPTLPPFPTPTPTMSICTGELISSGNGTRVAGIYRSANGTIQSNTSSLPIGTQVIIRNQTNSRYEISSIDGRVTYGWVAIENVFPLEPCTN